MELISQSRRSSAAEAIAEASVVVPVAVVAAAAAEVLRRPVAVHTSEGRPGQRLRER